MPHTMVSCELTSARPISRHVVSSRVMFRWISSCLRLFSESFPQTDGRTDDIDVKGRFGFHELQERAVSVVNL